MEYFTDPVTTVPEGTSPVKVDELKAAEAVRAAELANAGHLVRLWRPPLEPGDEADLRQVLNSLPLHIWMKVTITPLTPHPNDLEYMARQGLAISSIVTRLKERDSISYLSDVLSFFNYYTIAIACDILSTCIKQAGVSCMLHPVRHVNLTGISLLSRDKLQVVSLGNA